ncbi:Tubby- protein 2 [Coemansia sp. BCRC 34301]|nr:Tubby- protein 2 [Coemansia sp. BCRC 34301]
MSLPSDFSLLQQICLLCTSVPLAACTHCRLVRAQDRGANATLDLYEEPPPLAMPGADNNDNLGNHVLRAVKRKDGVMPWHYYYDIYLAPSLSPSLPAPGILVGRVVPTTVGGVYTILQRSLPDANEEPGPVQWQEVCAVQYDSHVLGSTGPREMTVIVHAVNYDSGSPPLADPKPLIDRHRMGADSDPGIVPLINKPPIFVSETATYALDFGPRVTMRSVKNFQLIHPHDKDYIVMQFGKSGPDSFALDIRFPMSPVMALGVAITSIDRKIIYNLSLPSFLH